MHAPKKSNINAAGVRMGIVVSRYHAEITESMERAATEVFVKSGGNINNLHAVPAAGAYELTAICRALASLKTRTGGPALDALVALGCIIAGETTHNQYLAASVTEGLTAITVQLGIPIGFGVLTCPSIEHARARTMNAGSANKGAEAMAAAIESANTIKYIETARGFR